MNLYDMSSYFMHIYIENSAGQPLYILSLDIEMKSLVKKKNEMYKTSFYFSMRKRNYLPKKLFLNKTCVQNEYT